VIDDTGQTFSCAAQGGNPSHYIGLAGVVGEYGVSGGQWH